MSYPDEPMELEVTDEQLEHFREYVLAAGQARKEMQETFNEVDFLCGALCFHMAFGLNDRVPADWIFGPLLGRDVIK